jgi:alpha-L-rhamnosidase
MRIYPVSAVSHLADANTRLRHPAERGAWIWHPGKGARETAVLRFLLRFTLPEAARAVFHVTADQRFQLRCDGRDVSFGPDRCDVDHWTVQTVRVELAAGAHELEALVWYIPVPTAELGVEVGPPMAQMTWRGGFLFVGEECGTIDLSTGSAAWMVEDVSAAISMRRPNLPGYHDVGPEYDFDLARWVPGEAIAAAIVAPPLTENPHGVRRPGWCLHPASLAEQERQEWRGGRVRASRPGVGEEPWTERHAALGGVDFDSWLRGEAPLVVPPGSAFTLLWDFEDYVCGYPRLRHAGGAGARIAWGWAESLYEESRPERVVYGTQKGRRGEIAGKVFVGIEDAWRPGGGGEQREIPALWWRCGRHVRLRVETMDEPLTLWPPRVLTTGYPLDKVGEWSSSNPAWDELMPIFERSLRRAAHEVWVDTPYYEQLGYVGDNLLMALHNYAWFGDARLSRRAIEQFDWSRSGGGGLVAERYPSGWRQESATFSLLWPCMVRDYAWWRDDLPFVRARLSGVRAVLAEFDAMSGEDGLLRHVPGWPFIDWVNEWVSGCGPGVREGDSSIVNLHHVMALQAAAQLEEAVGRPESGGLYDAQARKIFAAVISRYWDEARGAFLDTPGCAVLSEHAQAMALRTGLLDEKRARACLAVLCSPPSGTARASIYASFQVLDALYLHGEGAEFHRRLAWWRGLGDLGVLCTPEAPEPTRSDSHAWGAHPAWHSLASVAGVRPAAPFFSRVRIAPCLGDLTELRCAVSHPRGQIELHLVRDLDSEALTAELRTPVDVELEIVWQGLVQQVPASQGEARRVRFDGRGSVVVE